LVNSALAALLRGNNTTISIAHRLSTIKRSDSIIVLGANGTVAEQGTYHELSGRPNGAFTRLMEWQMSGGETQQQTVSSQGRPPFEDQLERLQKDDPELDEEEDEETRKQSN
jgi:putative ABC transport system ATP-binding protein